MKQNLKERVKSKNGITLIALVITIIVLLILAGVTIATLTGDNGILTKAQSTKIQSERASIKEQIELAVVASRINDNLDESIDTTILEAELDAINGLNIESKGTDDNLPWTVTVREFRFQIKEDGTIKEVNGISLSATKLKIITGETETINATLTEGVTGTITWESSNNSLVTVNNGTVTAVGNSGTVTIKAKCGSYEATCEVTIVQKVTKITLSASSTTVKEGSTLQLTIGTEPSSGEIEKIEFSSSKESVATVSNSGVVTGVAVGNATITATGKSSGVTGTINITVKEGIKAPTSWVKTTKTDSSWYSYAGANVNEPKLIGQMTPIKYNLELPSGANTTNKWANAITADGSMWVWIPRYAYKITYYTDSNYTTTSTTKTQYGKIDVAFVKYENGQNTFLNSTDSGTITTDPTSQGAGTTNWLVHPAFVNNVNNGGWDSELSGIWVGKFEATGNYSNSTGTLSVLPANNALTYMTINQQYKFAQTGTFGEIATLNSHMAKNSEWGAIVYLAYSMYGTGGIDIAKSSNGTITGGITSTSTPEKIYNENYSQSTTNNPYGVYDLRGGSYERVASYVNYENNSFDLLTYGGTNEGDLYGSALERSTSTRYKTVYAASGTSQGNSYELAASKKGDAIYETSTSYQGRTSWNNGTGNGVNSIFPTDIYPFFYYGGGCTNDGTGMFFFDKFTGDGEWDRAFRVILCP
ncbi:MAG: Ig-like domain-containing protein [Clostridia bacterium]